VSELKCLNELYYTDRVVGVDMDVAGGETLHDSVDVAGPRRAQKHRFIVRLHTHARSHTHRSARPLCQPTLHSSLMPRRS